MDLDRTKDPEYPRTYESWTSDRGQLMVIQDLRPEDDDVVLELMEKNMLPDETLTAAQKLVDDPSAVLEMLGVYEYCLKQRVSIGCYEVKEGEKYLVGLNILVAAKKEKPDFDIKTDKVRNVYNSAMYIQNKCNVFEHMGLDKLVQGIGLCVRRDYRGMNIGQKILVAREPLCKALGIRGSSTLFTGIASQKQAEQSGFRTIAELTLKQLTEAGIPYPDDDERIIKYMIKEYDW